MPYTNLSKKYEAYKRWRERYPERKHQGMQRYLQTEHGRAMQLARDARHAARRRKHPLPSGDLTAEQITNVLRTSQDRCAYCGVRSFRMGIDHVTPFAKGGANTLHNIVAACWSCNDRKHTGPPLRPVQLFLL